MPGSTITSLFSLPLTAPLTTSVGDCWKCGEPLSTHPVYEGTCYPVCRGPAPPVENAR